MDLWGPLDNYIDSTPAPQVCLCVGWAASKVALLGALLLSPSVLVTDLYARKAPDVELDESYRHAVANGDQATQDRIYEDAM